MDDEGDALTEKEWREMRRRMPSLQFEPVPETPALLPRSFYGNDDGADEDEREDEDNDSDASPFFRGAAEDLRAVHAECSVPSPVVDASSAASLDASLAWSLDDHQKEETVSRAASDTHSETPPRSVTPPRKAVFPLTAATLASSKRRSIKSPSQILRRSEVTSSQDGDSSVSIATPPPPPVDLADLDSAIANAQEQLRVTILSTVRESTTRHEREATLERRKLEAAHANQLALLQSQLDELQTQTLAQQQQAHDATQALERATTLMVKWKQQEVGRWPFYVQSDEYNNCLCDDSEIDGARRTRCRHVSRRGRRRGSARRLSDGSNMSRINFRRHGLSRVCCSSGSSRANRICMRRNYRHSETTTRDRSRSSSRTMGRKFRSCNESLRQHKRMPRSHKTAASSSRVICAKCFCGACRP
jgi:hypothetical protein